MDAPVRITVDRTRLLYWDGVPYARWPSGRRRNPDGSVRWPFVHLVRMVRMYAGPGRPFEIGRRVARDSRSNKDTEATRE